MSKKLLMNTNLTEQDSYRRYYQEYEGTFITATDKSEDDTIDTSRFIEVTEIWGNTVQDENNLEDIQSVGELYVDEQGQPILDDLGREQYKFEIESLQNRNLFNRFNVFKGWNSDAIYNDRLTTDNDIIVSVGNNPHYGLAKGIIGQQIRLKPNTQYVLEARVDTGDSYCCINNNQTGQLITKTQADLYGKVTFNSGDNEDVFIVPYIGNNPSNVYKYINLYESILDNNLYETNILTPNWYNEFQSHKTTILLPCQLQKVGDVYDRLYWDSEKEKYVIEKNIEKDLLGDMSWVYQGSGVAYCARFKLAEKYMYSGNTTTYNIVSGFKNKPVVWSDLTTEEGFYNYASVKYLSIIKEPAISTLDEFILEVKNKKYYLLSVLKASQLIETNITEKILLPCYSEKTHIFVDSTVDASMKVLMPYKEII